MAHTLLYLLGYNAPEDALLPANFDWRDEERLHEAYCQLTAALRPWTIDFHIAQNNATVHGSGSHDKTGRHCLPGDPGGKLDIPRHAGYWLRDEKGELTKRIRHVCWDGCMFSNADDDEARHVERHFAGHDRRARPTRVAGVGVDGRSSAGRELFSRVRTRKAPGLRPGDCGGEDFKMLAFRDTKCP